MTEDIAIIYVFDNIFDKYEKVLLVVWWLTITNENIDIKD